jgi:hypothetical protein
LDKGEKRIRVSCQGRLTLIIIWYYISIIRKGRRSIRERGIRVSCQGRLTLIIIWYYVSIIRKGRRSIRERG